MTALSLTIQEVSDALVVAKNDQGEVWRLPRTSVIGVPRVGQAIRVLGIIPGQEQEDQRTFARTLLEELLHD